MRENPVINRIILEGNKRLKDDKITARDQARAAPDLHPPAARADVDRIIELYRRQGRFAARVEPKIVQLDQNRVDVVFEINEGDLAKVRAINIIGNDDISRRRACARRCTRSRPAASSASSSRTTPTIPTGLPPTSRSFAPST